MLHNFLLSLPPPPLASLLVLIIIYNYNQCFGSGFNQVSGAGFRRAKMTEKS
jgi:hypothetical protein